VYVGFVPVNELSVHPDLFSLGKHKLLLNQELICDVNIKITNIKNKSYFALF
jgi:hypothetical protein